MGAKGLALPAWARTEGAGTAGVRVQEPYAIADLFSFAGDQAVSLSPSGTRIAVLVQAGTAEAPVSYIEIVSATDPEGERGRIGIGALEAEAIEWGSDERLLVRMAIKDRTSPRANTGSNIRSQGIEYTSYRVVSISLDGRPPVVLFQDQRNRMRNSLDLGAVVDNLPSDPDHVLMAAWERDGVLGLHKVSIVDGSAVRIDRGNSATIGWSTLNGVPVLRYDINARGNLLTIHARAEGETDWRFLRRTRITDAPDFTWVGESGKPGVALIAARVEGEDVETIREMNLTTLEYGPPIHGRAGRDVLYGLKDSAGKFIGAAFYGERLEYDFTEPQLVAHHRALNRFFDNDCDVHLTDVDTARNRFIAYITGPREPGSWFFYDREARAIVPIASRMRLDFERLGVTEVVQVQTRDGAAIEAYLTAPPGGQPGPLVALVHGGPEARDYRDWDRQVQALAAQGWWVIRPNFRGSSGYGLAFASEGWRRWGSRMQHDVEDAVAHAIQLKGLDPARVGIMGTSYGGYAALMGPILRPDLYKAAISICGVADLPDMLTTERRDDDTPGQPIFGFWTKRIGVPGEDDAMLVEASPRRRATEFVCPVLLVHGETDSVVPVTQSRRMHDALRSAGKTVEYVEVGRAGHADWDDDQEKALLARYVALFSRVFA